MIDCLYLAPDSAHFGCRHCHALAYRNRHRERTDFYETRDVATAAGMTPRMIRDMRDEILPDVVWNIAPQAPDPQRPDCRGAVKFGAPPTGPTAGVTESARQILSRLAPRQTRSRPAAVRAPQTTGRDTQTERYLGCLVLQPSLSRHEARLWLTEERWLVVSYGPVQVVSPVERRRELSYERYGQTYHEQLRFVAVPRQRRGARWWPLCPYRRTGHPPVSADRTNCICRWTASGSAVDTATDSPPVAAISGPRWYTAAARENSTPPGCCPLPRPAPRIRMTPPSAPPPPATLRELMQRLHSDRPDWSENRRRQHSVAINKLTQAVGHVPTLQELETKGVRLLSQLKRRMTEEGLSRSAIASYRSHLLVLWREAHERSWLQTPPPYEEAGRPLEQITPRNYREVWALNFRRLRLKKFDHQGDFVRALAAQGLDVRHGLISQWERGIALPSILVVPTFAKVLGCRLSELFPPDKRGPAAS